MGYNDTYGKQPCANSGLKIQNNTQQISHSWQCNQVIWFLSVFHFLKNTMIQWLLASLWYLVLQKHQFH